MEAVWYREIISILYLFYIYIYFLSIIDSEN